MDHQESKIEKIEKSSKKLRSRFLNYLESSLKEVQRKGHGVIGREKARLFTEKVQIRMNRGAVVLEDFLKEELNFD